MTETENKVNKYFNTFLEQDSNQYLLKDGIEKLKPEQLEEAVLVANFCESYVNKTYKKEMMEHDNTKEKTCVHLRHFLYTEGPKSTNGNYIYNIYRATKFHNGRVIAWFSEFLRYMCSSYSDDLVFYFHVYNEKKRKVFNKERDTHVMKPYMGTYSVVVDFSKDAKKYHSYAVEFQNKKPSPSSSS